MQSSVNIISVSDIFIAIIYFILIAVIAYFIQIRNVEKHAEYKYFTKGLIAKLVGVSIFCHFRIAIF